MQNNFKWFSLLFDDSRVNSEFEVTKEVACMDSLPWSNYRREHFQKIYENIIWIQYEVEYAKMCYNNSSKNMYEAERGLFDDY